MVSRTVRRALVLLIAFCLLSVGYIRASAQSMAWNQDRKIQAGFLYEQPIDPNGKLFPSSRRDPDGSDYDQYVWEDFILPSGGTLTEIVWYGGYDPLLSGKGGQAVDFTISIYPSIAAGTEPAVANPPLVEYQVGGNAGETAFAVINGIQINVYSFKLPASFTASAGVKYWVQIEASQQGSIPDWGFIAGTRGSGNHYIRTSGAGGDVLYRFAPGDVSFALLGSSMEPMTPTPAATETLIPSNTPSTPTDTPAPTPTPVPQIPTCLGSIFTFMMLAIFFSEFRGTRP